MGMRSSLHLIKLRVTFPNYSRERCGSDICIGNKKMRTNKGVKTKWRRMLIAQRPRASQTRFIQGHFYLGNSWLSRVTITAFGGCGALISGPLVRVVSANGETCQASKAKQEGSLFAKRSSFARENGGRKDYFSFSSRDPRLLLPPRRSRKQRGGSGQLRHEAGLELGLRFQGSGEVGLQ